MTRSGKAKHQNQNGNKIVVNGHVDEATRIRISHILEEFTNGDDETYTFEAGLTNPERAVVHELSKKKGMISRSSGKGNQRCVTVFKRKKKRLQEGKKTNNITRLTFSEETKDVLQELFIRYPPSDGEQNEEKVTLHVGEVDKRQRVKDGTFKKPSMNKAEIAKNVKGLASRMNNTLNLRKIVEARSKLPIASFKDAITSTIENNQVVLISGETGCGKTTQVPQYLLDYIWGKGQVCKIVCTQPRRISAISVAERISYERGENVGDNIGYKIRMETRGGQQSSVMFCTNGILLRVLVGKGTSKSKKGSRNITSKEGNFEVTHIIVDEIHERDRFSDFILAILRDMLLSCPHLRLILMSATLDSERFSQYFGGCPIIRVPGFTYPVKSFYLEDILSILKSTESNHLDPASPNDTVQDTELSEDYTVSLDEAINLAWSSDEFDPLLDLISSEGTPKVCNYQHSLTGVSPLMVFAGKGRVSDVCMLLSLGANCNIQAKDGKTAKEWAERENQGEVVEIIKHHLENGISEPAAEEELLEKYLATVNPEHIDIILIERLCRKICTDSDEGAILVFLPGWDDINKTREKLLASPFFKDSSKFVIISLHSMVPSVEQKKVFNRPPCGSRKIILSTNIAETAITIDDVVYVIDSGRMKEKSYDPYHNVSTLHSSWVSKASAKQREGRAGRCQPGICYHLYSKTRATSLPDFQVPEIKRMPIEELCLQVKLLDPNSRIVDFLQKTLDPPVSETVNNAILILRELGALTLDEELTELGQKLGSLPVHPSTSKMLLFAILMNCLDPALTIACASENRDPFILPIAPNEKKIALSAKAELALLYGGHSDQLMVIAAYECWKRAKDKGQETWFCSKYFVSSSTMQMLSSMRTQLERELIRNGFMQEDASHCSLNARDPGILHAVLVSGLYPMVGKLLAPHRSGHRCVVETTSGAKVRLHPHSSNFKLSLDKSDPHPLVIYDEITRGDGGMYIRNCSIVGPHPLLLVASEMVVAPAEDNEDESDEDCYASGSDEDGLEMHTMSSGKREQRIMSNPQTIVSVVIDRWLTFESTALDVAQMYCLRERLQAAILFKVKYPRTVLPPALGASMYAIACILSYDGLSGIPPSFETIGSSTLMMNGAGINKSTPGKQNETSSSNSVSSEFLRSLMIDNAPHNYRHYNNPRQVSRSMHYNATPNTSMHYNVATPNTSMHYNVATTPSTSMHYNVATPNTSMHYTVTPNTSMHYNVAPNTSMHYNVAPNTSMQIGLIGRAPSQKSQLQSHVYVPPHMQIGQSQITQLQGQGIGGHSSGGYPRQHSFKRQRGGSGLYRP